MGLPFEPEIEDALRARYPDAVMDVYEVQKIMDGLARPGTMRKHVFDYFDGMRFIVSRDKVRNDIFLHISVSMQTGSMPKGPDLLRVIIEKLRDLCGGIPSDAMINVSATNSGIVHVIIPEAKTPQASPMKMGNPRWN